MKKPLTDEVRRRFAAYRDGLSPALPPRDFLWSGALLTPSVDGGTGALRRESFGSVQARTWVEAATLVAEENRAKAPAAWVNDVMLRDGDTVELAWGRHGPGGILENLALARRDTEEAPPCAKSAS